MRPVCPRCSSDEIILSHDQSYGKCRYCDEIFEIKIPRRILNEEEICALLKKREKAMESRKLVEDRIKSYSKTVNMPKPGSVIGYMFLAVFICFIICLVLTIFGLDELVDAVGVLGLLYEAGSVCYLIYWIFAYPIAKHNIGYWENIKNQYNAAISEVSGKISELSR